MASTQEPARPAAANDGARRVVRLAPADDARYREVVGRLVPALEARLGAEVVANRAIGRGAHAWTSLEPWRPARHAFLRALRRAAAGRDVTLIDVHRCYGSIDVAAVASRVRGLSRRDVAALLRLLGRFEDEGMQGLPIGPEPSAILANAVLAGVDEAVRRTGARHVRWVDDVAIAGDDAGTARAVDAATEALASVGLTINERKTRIVSFESLRRSASAAVPSHFRAK